jgi:hypothetical protein
VLALLSLALLGCAGGTGANDDTAKSGSEDEGHPLVPDAYDGLWDIESLGCDDATVYYAFTGAIDDAGTLTGEETWYWFFAEEGWDADCADPFVVEAVEEPTPIEDDACLSCDRDFTAVYTLDEDRRTCPLEGYESLFDNDDRDRIDEEIYTLAVMFDTNPLEAAPGVMNVWSYAQDDQDADTWIDRGIAAGTLPVEAATAGPGAVTWASPDGLCVTFEEE